MVPNFAVNDVFLLNAVGCPKQLLLVTDIDKAQNQIDLLLAMRCYLRAEIGDASAMLTNMFADMNSTVLLDDMELHIQDAVNLVESGAMLQVGTYPSIEVADAVCRDWRDRRNDTVGISLC